MADMGSMALSDVTITNADELVPKLEPIDTNIDTPSTDSFSPEPESATLPAEGASASQEPPPVVKRKGGRKPIYATSEERKQRNRQAQAAFRERRTEYIKQLETTIQQHEESLASLQQSHRTAADECLMLRYKNSLLERILLEKGIDVQGELRLKSSPHLRPIGARGAAGQASPMQRAMLNRQQQQRQQRHAMAPPPLIQTPTPPSNHSSPNTVRSPGFSMPPTGVSPGSDIQPQRLAHPTQSSRPVQHIQPHIQPRPHQRSLSQNTQNTSNSNRHSFAGFSRQQAQMSPANFYPASFQKHYDQLDQEYDAQVDMLDDIEGEDADPDTFIPNFRLPPQTNHANMGVQASPSATASVGSDAGTYHSTLPFTYDPILDADPFGLTASMHFPNTFGMPPRR